MENLSLPRNTPPKEWVCFVATAAFGSPVEPQVEILRQFRDQYLKTNLLGQEFVKYYYKYSPPVAEKIAHSPRLQLMTRQILKPLIFFADHLISD